MLVSARFLGRPLAVAPPRLLPRSPSAASWRGFRAPAEHAAWVKRVLASCAPRPVGAPLAPSDEDAEVAAPFLFSVDPMAHHLEVYAAPHCPVTDPRLPRPYGASLVEAKYPLATDAALRTAVSDLGCGASDSGGGASGAARPTFRLSKFLEAVLVLARRLAWQRAPKASLPQRARLKSLTLCFRFRFPLHHRHIISSNCMCARRCAVWRLALPYPACLTGGRADGGRGVPPC